MNLINGFTSVALAPFLLVACNLIVLFDEHVFQDQRVSQRHLIASFVIECKRQRNHLPYCCHRILPSA